MIGNSAGGLSGLFDSLIWRGLVFSTAKRLTIPASGAGVLDILIDPTALSAKDKLLFTPLAFKAFGAGPINIDIYFGGNIANDGTPIDSFNRDTRSGNTAGVIVQTDPTVTTPGTRLPIDFIIFSDGIPATASIGGSQVEDLPFNSRIDGKYLIRLTNQEANPASAWAGFNWAEIIGG